MKKYVNLENIPNFIDIKSYITCNWPYKIGFKYKNLKKEILIDNYERLNIIKDCENFLKMIKKLKLSFIKFIKNGSIKDKKCLFNCVIGGKN